MHDDDGLVCGYCGRPFYFDRYKVSFDRNYEDGNRVDFCSAKCFIDSKVFTGTFARFWRWRYKRYILKGVAKVQEGLDALKKSEGYNQ
jgi:hypothetical protein